MKKQLAIGVLALVCASQAVRAAEVTDPATGHRYQLYSTPATWNDAKTTCENAGGHLATITSKAENEFVYKNVAQKGKLIWLGGTDEASEGNWRWVTGETWNYTDWASNNPNDAVGGQDYLAYWDYITGVGTWDDNGGPNASDLVASFICEWDSSSTTGNTDPTGSTGGTQTGDCTATYIEPTATAAGKLTIPCVAVPLKLPFGGTQTFTFSIEMQQRTGSFTFDLDTNSVKQR